MIKNQNIKRGKQNRTKEVFTLLRNKQVKWICFFMLSILFPFTAYTQTRKLNIDSIFLVEMSKKDKNSTSNTSDTIQKIEKLSEKTPILTHQTVTDSIKSSSKSIDDVIAGKIIEEYNEPSLYDIIVKKSFEMLNDSSIQHALDKSRQQHLSETDIATYYGNPFFIDLIYMGIPIDIQWKQPSNFTTLYHGTSAVSLDEIQYSGVKFTITPKSLYDVREDARQKIAHTEFDLYETIFTELPNPNKNKSRHITTKPLTRVQFVDEDFSSGEVSKTPKVEGNIVGPWQKTANIMVQFSQNYVSSNWHQGGSSNMAVLAILTGRLNYNDKKKVQWENSGEWRAGFMNVGDTTALRMFNTNDDVLKINSKLGIKAGGNWFYSSNLDFSTHFLHNYQAVNSDQFMAKFLTPVRMNVGIGMDYKYKNLFSIMIAPVAYKFIFANDTKNIDPNTFGIKTGESTLHEIGSSFIAQCAYAPSREIQVNSKLKFYTNYEKVEIDWEIIGVFKVNRFLTTRISLNPRYDNTVILKEGEKAKIQFKELLSFGFSFRLH